MDKIDRIFKMIQKAIDKFQLNSYISYYQKELFLVVNSWKERKQIERFIHYELISKIIDIDNRIGFNDEYIICVECNNIIKITPNNYFDIPKHFNGYCLNCIDIEYYLKEIENNPRQANIIYSDNDLITQGYKKFNNVNYETGLHIHQTDDPLKIYDELKSKYKSIVFHIDNKEQFSIYFDVYIK